MTSDMPLALKLGQDTAFKMRLFCKVTGGFFVVFVDMIMIMVPTLKIAGPSHGINMDPHQ